MFKRFFERCWSVLWATWKGWQQDDGAQLSAATAYYATFSFFAFCLIVIASLGFVGRYSKTLQVQQDTFIAHVSNNVSPWLADQLQGILTAVEARAVLGGPLGLIALLVAAIGIFTQLVNVFDHIWDVPESQSHSWWAAVRSALWDRLLAFVTLLAIGVSLMVVSLADAILAGFRNYLAQLPAGQSTWLVLQWLSTLGCNAILLTVLYRVLPRPPIRWLDAFLGGLLAALIWSLGRYLLLLLVVGERYSPYGVVGALMGMMLWFYFAAAVVFLGAEFVHALRPEWESKGVSKTEKQQSPLLPGEG
jgi:membrane protein